MKVLGIETSCDETSMAIVDETRHIHAHVIWSQFKDHAGFGGVVPEIAARAHVQAIDHVLREVMAQASITCRDLDGVAATAGPGLIGGVMVGLVMGKTLAAYADKPFIGVNHLEGHALSPRLSDNVNFPYILLLISGGHSQIFWVEDVGRYTCLGGTLDDAAGECFDKSAKLLGLPYPGGPHLEALAATCLDPDAAMQRFSLPRPLLHVKDCRFSFSGLKTAMKLATAEITHADGTVPAADAAALAYAFEQCMADILADRCRNALALAPARPTALVVAGGVAANKTIRAALTACAAQAMVPFVAPPPILCTDNGAMIAWAGLERLQRGERHGLDIQARPRWPLDPHQETVRMVT